MCNIKNTASNITIAYVISEFLSHFLEIHTYIMVTLRNVDVTIFYIMTRYT